MMPALIIARLTLREASRRRLLVAVAILTVVLVGFTAWGFERLLTLPCGGQPCGQQEVTILAASLLILVIFMYSFVFSLGAVFVTSPSIAGEIESGVMLAMLPRPLRRRDLVLGRWIGLGVLVGGYTIATTALEFLAVALLVGYVPPWPIQSVVYLVGEALVMLTLALAISTRLAPMAGGIVALILFGLGWMGGIAHAIGRALGSDVVATVGLVTSLALPTDGLWRGALFHLEPAVMVAMVSGQRSFAANPFFTAAPPSTAYVIWAVAWIIAILGLAVVSFNRREL